MQSLLRIGASLAPALQIGVSIALIVLILLQERQSGTSGLFGGSEGSFYQTRRGLEHALFVTTIVLIVAFAGLSLLSLVL